MFKYISAVILMLITSYAFSAGFGINATRIIYNENDKTKTVGIRNTTKDIAYLVQTKVLMPDDKQSPFETIPPIFRLEQGNTNQVKIIKNNNIDLPKDQESLFYFIGTAIPGGKLGNENNNDMVSGAINIAIANKIKLFYRPSNLASTPEEAQKGLTFKSTSKGIEMINNSPYYVSISSLNIAGKKVQTSVEEGNSMIAPYSQQTYNVKASNGKVYWIAINDIGGENVYSASIQK
ncbi:molecular chaperone [Moellerella wisconsensis]|uniref:fimbrial biogenesis chaperone n=1 Tax=Moellerella wisconsensis TaxID=158849 RepID=UPI001F4F0390|nr:molecular chaperone [Moellerella wisconsensis]UNH43408.1 molecular chaperone [Moellerella wisconsensis]